MKKVIRPKPYSAKKSGPAMAGPAGPPTTALMIGLDSYSRQVFIYLDPILIYISLWINCLFVLLAMASKTYIGSVLFRTSAYINWYSHPIPI